ncbi:MAG: hypothetical protein U5R46_00695 [Gammaproteobacteria bacterium]|nr:hypothetical protein [Gammaproteobacteria bacterium]
MPGSTFAGTYHALKLLEQWCRNRERRRCRLSRLLHEPGGDAAGAAPETVPAMDIWTAAR